MARTSKPARKAAKARPPLKTKGAARKVTSKRKFKARSSPSKHAKIRKIATRATRISAALVAAHGLKPEEYERLRSLIGRAPTFTELGIFSAMWNEHCSYKSSKIHLRTLPTQ